MFRPGKPSEGAVKEFLRAQQDEPFSYEGVGSSRNPSPPDGYVVDHNRARLGEGEEVFRRAVEAMNRWEMFDVGWVSIFPPDAPIGVETTVAVVARIAGFWSPNACRVVYRLDEEVDGVRRFGFAYGTLPAHAERGEERFTVEWRRDGSVWYDLYAFSRPNHPLARIGYPVARTLQRRFARDSLAAMVRAVGS